MNKYLLLIILFLYNSCSLVIGYKKLKSVDIKKIEIICNQFKPDHCITLDSTYISRLRASNLDSLTLKDFYQPLQVHYINSGKIVSSLINCYAGNGFNLEWNDGNRLNNCPPAYHKDYSSVSINVLNQIYNNNLFNNLDNYIVIVWTNAFKKKSKELIELLFSTKDIQCKNYKYILVNNDSLFCD